MADETSEQLREQLAAADEQAVKATEQLNAVTAHRDQLKAEADRLNPENDALKATVATLTQALADANAAKGSATAAAAKDSADAAAQLGQLNARDAERVKLCEDVRAVAAKAQDERDAALVRLATMKADHVALVNAVATAAGPILTVLESIRTRSD